MTSKIARYPEAGAYIKGLRQKVEMTQVEVNKFIGFPHYTTYSNIESGRMKLAADKFEPTARALGVDLFEFTRRLSSYYYPDLYHILFRLYQCEPSRGKKNDASDEGA
ncbi:helix-turn-helix domain-containing protein [Sneathiella chinensis]|uniref:HTH cro/C1-type domain-containing protein n=1 Tax=Sneathiella chinensis TaxID=349750 RepID=A0ABQ5UAB5_9PROT|nr:helix-turn-helix transcriptional regulator [Sneathiella chinensis]GLQ07496.1 hypothetical protein GCM10007924_27170 [Sneathiella chinensis]